MKLSKRDKKFISAGAAALIIFCAFKFGLFPLYDTFLERRSEIAQKENTKEKYLKFLNEQADFQKSSTGRGKEEALVAHLTGAELYASAPKDGVFVPPVDYPAHERCVEVEVDLGCGEASSTVIGGDLTHEYVSENADYRS